MNLNLDRFLADSALALGLPTEAVRRVVRAENPVHLLTSTVAWRGCVVRRGASKALVRI